MATKVIPGWLASMLAFAFVWLRSLVLRIEDAYAKNLLSSVIDFGTGVVSDLSDDNPENIKQIEMRFRRWVEEGPVFEMTKAKLEELITAKIDDERWQGTLLFITPRTLDLTQLLLDTDTDNRAQINAFVREAFGGENFLDFLELWLSALTRDNNKAEELANFVRMAIAEPQLEEVPTKELPKPQDPVVSKRIVKTPDGGKKVVKERASGKKTVIKK